MVKQYPYRLYAEIRPESYQDARGNWVTCPPARHYIGECRDEPLGAGALHTGIDGQKYAYSGIIYLPKGTEALPAGTPIAVEDAQGTLRIAGKVLRSSKDQLHTRLWV